MLCADPVWIKQKLMLTSSLNPCFNGCYALMELKFWEPESMPVVLILVLMDVMR